jgi:hypothetical protein
VPRPIFVDDHGHRRLAGPIVSMPSAKPATSRSTPLELNQLLDRIQVDGEAVGIEQLDEPGGAPRRRSDTAQEPRECCKQAWLSDKPIRKPVRQSVAGKQLLKWPGNDVLVGTTPTKRAEISPVRPPVARAT